MSAHSSFGNGRPQRSASSQNGTPCVPAGDLRRWVTMLVREGADTDEAWERISEALAHHGCATLRAWLADGSLRWRVHRISGRRLHLANHKLLDRDAVDEIVGATVAVSLRRFRRRAMARTGWTPRSGISVYSYFAGGCLLAFPEEYRRWYREQRPRNEAPSALASFLNVAGTDVLSRPADVAIDRCLVGEMLRQSDRRTRRALLGLLYGYPLSVVAARLGTTVEGVELLLYQCRVRIEDGTSPYYWLAPSSSP